MPGTARRVPSSADCDQCLADGLERGPPAIRKHRATTHYPQVFAALAGRLRSTNATSLTRSSSCAEVGGKQLDSLHAWYLMVARTSRSPAPGAPENVNGSEPRTRPSWTGSSTASPAGRNG